MCFVGLIVVALIGCAKTVCTLRVSVLVGEAADSVPLGMCVSLYATILQFLRSCLVTIRTIRTSVREKHNWMYASQMVQNTVFIPKLENSFNKSFFILKFNFQSYLLPIPM